MRKYKDRISLSPEQIEEIKEKLKAQGTGLGALAEIFGGNCKCVGHLYKWSRAGALTNL